MSIDEPHKTKSFGNDNVSLGFSHKINLLIDSGTMMPERRKKLQCLLEMRNQFAHNLRAVDFTECLKFTGTKAPTLLGWYELKEETEENLSTAFDKLVAEARAIGDEVVEKAVDRWKDTLNREIDHNAMRHFLKKRLEFTRKHTETAMVRLLEQRTFAAEEVRDMIRDIDQQIHDTILVGMKMSLRE